MEQQEHLILAPYACFADESRGRDHAQEESDTRTCFQRDTDRILHSKSFRRLMHKTQVFLQPEGDHYRTRLTHTLEVSHIARSIARGLQLNQDLAEAIAMGHDLGHPPFGHAGEVALSEVMGKEFNHNEQSLRVVDLLENGGEGLNLTYETRMGILGHTWSARPPETLEGMVIRYADRIAYMNHDIDDAMRGGILTEDDIPHDLRRAGADSHSRAHQHAGRGHHLTSPPRTGTLSDAAGGRGRRWTSLRQFMFAHVYRNPSPRARRSRRRTSSAGSMSITPATRRPCPTDMLPQLDFDGLSRMRVRLYRGHDGQIRGL
jgi:dGTPase